VIVLLGIAVADDLDARALLLDAKAVTAKINNPIQGCMMWCDFRLNQYVTWKKVRLKDWKEPTSRSSGRRA
jgi:hypothetical protein